MALTQAQKDIISEISQNPEKILTEFKEFPSIINTFKNEFFQDGTSLLDKVLYQYCLTKKDIFFDLYCFIVDNSNVSPFDFKGHKLSAINHLYQLKESNFFEDFNESFFKILNYKKLQNSDFNFYIIEKHILNLYLDKDFYSFQLLFEKYKDDYRSFHKIGRAHV